MNSTTNNPNTTIEQEYNNKLNNLKKEFVNNVDKYGPHHYYTNKAYSDLIKHHKMGIEGYKQTKLDEIQAQRNSEKKLLSDREFANTVNKLRNQDMHDLDIWTKLDRDPTNVPVENHAIEHNSRIAPTDELSYQARIKKISDPKPLESKLSIDVLNEPLNKQMMFPEIYQPKNAVKYLQMVEQAKKINKSRKPTTISKQRPYLNKIDFDKPANPYKDKTNFINELEKRKANYRNARKVLGANHPETQKHYQAIQDLYKKAPSGLRETPYSYAEKQKALSSLNSKANTATKETPGIFSKALSGLKKVFTRHI